MPYAGKKGLGFWFLKAALPTWLAEDIYARLTHPYWRRKRPVSGWTTSQRVATVAATAEKTSNRPPMKHSDPAVVLETLKRHNVQKILDVGCGQGHLVRLLSQHGFRAQGITINPQEVTAAGDAPVCLCDIQDPHAVSQLKDQPFDAVLSFDCLEHLKRPLEALQHINQVLKMGGLLICYIPPARWIECDYHIIVYTPRQFRWLLNLAGFDLLQRLGRYRFSKKGITYIAQKCAENRPVYPPVLE